MTIKSIVVQGNKVGRTLGYPTANLRTNDDITQIATGTYVAIVWVKDIKYIGVLNIGYRPTICKDSALSAEVHILDFDEDIYGQTIHVTPLKFLRPEQKFNNREELISRIAQDVISARRVVV